MLKKCWACFQDTFRADIPITKLLVLRRCLGDNICNPEVNILPAVEQMVGFHHRVAVSGCPLSEYTQADKITSLRTHCEARNFFKCIKLLGDVGMISYLNSNILYSGQRDGDFAVENASGFRTIN